MFRKMEGRGAVTVMTKLLLPACYSMGPPAKTAWAAVVQDRKTHRQTDTAFKRLKLKALIHFVSRQNSSTGSNKKLCDCATGRLTNCRMRFAPGSQSLRPRDCDTSMMSPRDMPSTPASFSTCKDTALLVPGRKRSSSS